MRFINGLKPEIRSVVLMQRPKNLNTACTLALLKAEVAVLVAVRSPRSGDWSSYQSTKYSAPSPPRHEKPQSALPSDIPGSSLPESKFQAVKSYSRAMGLCFKCASKWSKDHKCPPEILLAVADLWDADDHLESPPTSPEAEHSSDKIFLALSKAATGATSSVHTVQFEGTVGDHPVLIRIDSGSSASFISTKIANT
jgi:hypothetical protein